MTTTTAPATLDRHWPAEGVTRVPFWAYSDPQVYEQEMSRIFCGESWARGAWRWKSHSRGFQASDDWRSTSGAGP